MYAYWCALFVSSDEEDMKPVRIAVVGAGAVGLSTALCIQDRIRNCDVHIIAEKFSPSTTSDGSAGLWTPFLVPQDQIDIVMLVDTLSLYTMGTLNYFKVDFIGLIGSLLNAHA